MNAELAALRRRLTTVLFVSQSLASAALIANVTINPILGVQLSGSEQLAGLPGTILLIGAASASYPAGRLMQQFGRRPGLTVGMLAGLAGMTLSGVAVLFNSFLIFLAGLALIGAARGITDQSRYAAADVANLAERGKSISTIVLAGTVGAVFGPALVGPLDRLSRQFGLPEHTGPQLGGMLLFALAALILFALLRPDPREIATRLAARDTSADNPAAPNATLPARPLRELLAQPNTQLALLSMVIGQVAMVTVMTVTSLHMHHHDHGMDTIGIVISAHTLGMFGTSFITGRLVDRFGRSATIALGVGVLVIGALLAPLSLLTPWLSLALFLVGFGWNLCYIAGSTLLADSVTLAERGSAQGISELLVNLSSAVGSLSSGFILAAAGYSWLCLLGAAISLIPLLLIGWQNLTRTRLLKQV
jgi:MFS family permease